MGLIEPGRPVILSYQPSPTRKLAYTLQAIQCEGNTWVGCNTHLPNLAVEAAIKAQLIPALEGYPVCLKEVAYGENKRSRIDLLLQGSHTQPDAYVEVKNVTLRIEDAACFPDAVTERGLKHLQELIQMRKQGKRAVMVFFIQRDDCVRFRIAHEIDPAYQQAFQLAQQEGVEVVELYLRVNPMGISFVPHK